MAPHAIAGARAIARSGRLSGRAKLFAAATGLAFASLPLAMKVRMRSAENRQSRREPIPG
jgi:hypothetical protein